MQEISMDIDGFADYMFQKNNNSIMALTLPELHTEKDLFYFFLDLFCKGLVILFGVNDRVEIDKLTLNDFNIVKNKMKWSGIIANLEIIPETCDLIDGTFINVSDIENLPDNLNIKEYRFNLLTKTSMFSVYFDLKIPGT